MSANDQHEDCKEGEHDTEGDLRGDHVLRGPFRHLERVGRAGEDDEDRDERRDEREVVGDQEGEGAPGPRLARDERKDGHVDLSRAERVEERHEESAAEPRDDDRRTAPALHRDLADEDLHPLGKFQRHDREDGDPAEADGIPEAEEREDEERERQDDHEDGADGPQPFERPKRLHEAESHQDVGEERSGAERETARDPRLPVPSADRENANEGDHDRKRTGVESVHESGEEHGGERVARGDVGISDFDRASDDGDCDDGKDGIVAIEAHGLRELAQELGLQGDGQLDGFPRRDLHGRKFRLRATARLHPRNPERRVSVVP